MNPKSIQRSVFAPPPLADWRAQVERDLKGADFDKRLICATPEGLNIHPLYTDQDRPTTPDYSGLPGGQSRVRGERPIDQVKTWQVCSVIREPETGAAADLALAELESGATGLLFERSSPWANPSLWLRLFEQLQGQPAHISLPSSARKTEVVQQLIEAANASSHPADALHIYAGVDIIGDYAERGEPNPEGWRETAALIGAHHSLPGRLMRSSDAPYHLAGGSESQSLGFTLAGAVDSFRRLEALQISVDTASAELEFLLHLDTEFFMGIAKIRAARWLWQQIRQACGFRSPLRIHVRTSPRILTRRDPWVNMLRNTTACFAGSVGGADAISTDAFDARLGVPGQTGQRLARNTQLILGQESHLDKVADPAGGSYFIEQLTEELTTEAWSVFQQVEARGGMLQALESGWVLEQLRETSNARKRAIRQRKRPITGVSEFPNLAEQLPHQQPYPTDETTGATQATGPWSLAPEHFARPFESFRERSDELLAERGQRPQVGLVNLGSVARHTARSTFIRNLVQAGGFEARPSEPVHTVEAALELLQDFSAVPLILCGSNADAKQLARPLARALRAEGASLIWLAGKPEEDMSSYVEAGIAEWVALGDDMVDRLQSLWAHVEST